MKQKTIKFIKFLYNLLFISWPMHIVMLITSLLPNNFYTTKIRGFLLRPFFRSCGKNFKIASGVNINHPKRISIGENVYIAHNNWINGAGGLVIGDNVQIGPMSVIVTSKHLINNGLLSNKSEMKKVEIGNNTWISSHVVITHGVKIGERVVVGAGAVVTRSIDSDLTVGGIPAKIL